MANRPIKTRWGGRPRNHPPIVLEPANTSSDLVVESKVLVQSFFSLQRHEYQYHVHNGTDSNNLFCNMNVNWVGPEIKMESAPPGRTLKRKHSFYSPKQIEASVDADVLVGVGRTPSKARAVRGEAARAYVPWTQGVVKGLWETVKGVKEVLGAGKTLSTLASLETPIGNLFIESKVFRAGSHFQYELEIVNRSPHPIVCKIPGLVFDRRISEGIQPSEKATWTFVTVDTPTENSSRFEYSMGPISGSFPVSILAPPITVGASKIGALKKQDKGSDDFVQASI